MIQACLVGRPVLLSGRSCCPNWSRYNPARISARPHRGPVPGRLQLRNGTLAGVKIHLQMQIGYVMYSAWVGKRKIGRIGTGLLPIDSRSSMQHIDLKEDRGI